MTWRGEMNSSQTQVDFCSWCTQHFLIPHLWKEKKGLNCRLLVMTLGHIHSKKSHTNQLGFSYSKALRSINLFQSSRCLLFEIWVIFCYFSEVPITYMNFVLIWLDLCNYCHLNIDSFVENVASRLHSEKFKMNLNGNSILRISHIDLSEKYIIEINMWNHVEISNRFILRKALK